MWSLGLWVGSQSGAESKIHDPFVSVVSVLTLRFKLYVYICILVALSCMAAYCANNVVVIVVCQ